MHIVIIAVVVVVIVVIVVCVVVVVVIVVCVFANGVCVVLFVFFENLADSIFEFLLFVISCYFVCFIGSIVVVFVYIVKGDNLLLYLCVLL